MAKREDTENIAINSIFTREIIPKSGKPRDRSLRRVYSENFGAIKLRAPYTLCYNT